MVHPDPESDASSSTTGVSREEGLDEIPRADLSFLGRYLVNSTDTAATWIALRGARARRYYEFLMFWSLLPGFSLAARGIYGGAIWLLPAATFCTGAFILGAPYISGLRIRQLSPAARDYTLNIDTDGVRTQDATGLDGRVAWRASLGLIEAEGRLFVALPGDRAVVIPRRAWATEGEFQAVVTFVRSRLKPFQHPLRRSVLIPWALLNAMTSLHVLAHLMR